MSNNLLNFFKKDRFAYNNGIRLIKVEPGFAVAQMTVTENHLNAANVVQGGAIFTLADFDFAAAANSYGFITLGASANISYFKPPKGNVLTAKASKISSGKRLCFYTVDVFDENEDIVARFTATGYTTSGTILEADSTDNRDGSGV
ncbi:MAG TPA: PaaI family thioesterase [Clostridiaceae bacterium]|nr:PaaI family thioesterase [Clostridiaceae bacterium]